ncbi:hypothetical protein DPMN_179338 [Dreissena polymorpha]|uniref:Uncharacterized protein n=1 Tax=Dreissena polymorpha TaxID=45954 RepID=A0A9D4IKP2_DREPO|nr:hypothetical protein DPMN_179338 [Dreissena polymorpha]
MMTSIAHHIVVKSYDDTIAHHRFTHNLCGTTYDGQNAITQGFGNAQGTTDDVRRTKMRSHKNLEICKVRRTTYDGQNPITQGFGNMQGTTDGVRRTKCNHTNINNFL